MKSLAVLPTCTPMSRFYRQVKGIFIGILSIVLSLISLRLVESLILSFVLSASSGLPVPFAISINGVRGD